MKNIYVLVVGLCLLNQSFGQVKISGQVVDLNTKKPLENISVSIPELRRGVITDQEGHFLLNDLNKITYMINISEIGYASQNIYISLSRDTSILIQLEESPSELNEVVIVGVSRVSE